jgi:poly(hydroxyalkanoate) depolymerase family esterase
MFRHQRRYVLAASVSLGLLAASPAGAQSLTEVARSTWAGNVTLPSYISMHIYVPTKLAAKPPIVVSAHSCGSSADGQWGNIPKTKAAATANGFILILPDNTGQNCWDVGNPTSLKHDGGGDTQAVATMVTYALAKYNGDASRVYIFGGSSGGMMTQAMLAVYPELFKAGHARAGVPAGCWADGYDFAKQWSNTCAGGSVTKTAQQWGELVRSYYPGYSGHRPRIQLVQGGSDTTISSKDMAESIKEWTNVLGLNETATSKDTGYKGQASTYDRQFWKNACGFTVLESWVAPGQGHSMAYEEDALLKFFGLDEAGGPDPEDAACSGDGGVASSGGAGGTAASGRDGGMNAMPGTGGGTPNGGSRSGGLGGTSGRTTETDSSPGGTTGLGGKSSGTSGDRSSSGGASSSRASKESSNTSSNGGTTSKGGETGSGENAERGGSSGLRGSSNEAVGGSPGNGRSAAQSSKSSSGASAETPDGTSTGCSCSFGNHGEPSLISVAALLSVALGLAFHRRRQARRSSSVSSNPQ